MDGVLVEIAGPVLRGGKSQLFYLNDGKSAYLDTPDNPKLWSNLWRLKTGMYRYLYVI